jgi:hypothetical protein
MFAHQFKADGDGFLYRTSSRCAPLRLSAVERDDFIAAFNRSLNRLTWAVAGGSVALVLGCLTWDQAFNQGLHEMPFYVGAFLLIALVMIGAVRAWNAPARALAGHGSGR